jgi:hypothetical protein
LFLVVDNPCFIVKYSGVNRPEICTVAIGEDNVTWNIMAYRELTPEEAAQIIFLHLRKTSPRNRPKPFSTVTIHTMTGMLPGL